MTRAALALTVLAALGCDSGKLSRDAALELLTGVGVVRLECTATLPFLNESADGIQFDRGYDVTGCGNALLHAGLLTDARCGTEPSLDGHTAADICTARLAGPRVTGIGKAAALLFSCGSVSYTIESIATEGRHATVRYKAYVHGPEPESVKVCAKPVLPDDGTFAATRDDEGHWTMDRPAR